MKITTRNKGYAFLLFIGFVIWSCTKINLPAEDSTPKEEDSITQKDSVEVEEPDDEIESDIKGTFTDDCNLISYSDTLVFLSNDDEDYEIRPTRVFEGEYGSIPEGLDIDHNDGEIRVNKSESGLRYKVFFVPENSTDTCFTYLTISGVDYLSNIYVLNEADSLAIPVYNGGLFEEVPDDDDNEFDDGPDDDDDDGTDDEPLPGSEVIPQGVAINKRNGRIRLDNTVNNGVFGDIPVVGTTKKFRIFYRLGDDSKKALNKIDVQFHYFDTIDQVPEELRKRVEDIQQYYANFRLSGGNLRVLKLFAKPRPPDIIIVGRRRR